MLNEHERAPVRSGPRFAVRLGCPRSTRGPDQSRAEQARGNRVRARRWQHGAAAAAPDPNAIRTTRAALWLPAGAAVAVDHRRRSTAEYGVGRTADGRVRARGKQEEGGGRSEKHAAPNVGDRPGRLLSDDWPRPADPVARSRRRRRRSRTRRF